MASTPPLPLIRWDAPGPYAVAFSTRAGGVSEAPFDTLNLGRLTDDDPERVTENRRRLCIEAGADAGAAPVRPPGARADRPARGRPGRAGRRPLVGHARRGAARVHGRLPPRRARTGERRPAGDRGPARRVAGTARRHRAKRCRRARPRSLRGRDRPGYRPLLLRSGRRPRRAVPGTLRPGDRPQRPPRPVERGRAGASRRRRGHGVPRRPLHGLQARPLLLAPPGRETAPAARA